MPHDYITLMNKLEEYVRAVEILRGIYVAEKLTGISSMESRFYGSATFTTGMALDFGVKMGWVAVQHPAKHHYLSTWILTDKGKEFFGI